MPISMCTWCSRPRVTTLRTWRSKRSGQQLVGDVCDHCWLGTLPDDDCRTCKIRRAHRMSAGLATTKARPIQPEDVPALLAAARTASRGRH